MFDAIAHRLAGLRARYAEPHRAYHGQAHIDAMLAGLREGPPDLAVPHAVELAIWYHDAIYDPATTDNEARSAALLRAEMAGLADPTALSQAEALVLMTATHTVAAGLGPGLAHDAAFFLDLDMAVLGADADSYDAYERGIAAEYLPIHGHARFTAGRAHFLRGLLGRDRLFLTERCHVKLDPAARSNIARALQSLG